MSKNGQKGIFRFQHGYANVNHTALLNHLIKLYGFCTYLEIGVRRRSSNYNSVAVEHKIVVDPDPTAEADYVTDSDTFFHSICDQQFDLIYIDGSHLAEQVEKDIENSLKVLHERGVILMHDCNPPTKFHAREEYEVNGTRPAWNGTVWKAFAKFRKTRSDLEMYVIDTDWGCGFIRRGSQSTINHCIASYEDLENNRKEILNLISVEQFLAAHPVSWKAKIKTKIREILSRSKRH
jgi:hypothetical protein